MAASDICVIGAGVMGMSSALTLANEGASVTLIDKRLPGQESSWAGGGILSPLVPWQESPPIMPLVHHSQSLYTSWIKALEEKTGIQTAYMASGLQVTADHSASIDKALHDRGYNNSAPQKASHTYFEKTTQGYFFPHVAQVRNPRLLRALYRACYLHPRIHCIEEEVCRLHIESSTYRGVVGTKQTIASEQLVVAAGAWSWSLLPDAPMQPGIYPVRGQMLLLHAPGHRLSSIVLQDGHYWIPRDACTVLVGSTVEHAGFDKRTTQEGQDTLLRASETMREWLGDFQVAMIWAGLRPGSDAGIPWIGPWPSLKNTWLLSGHFRYGLTMAPASSLRLSRQIMSKQFSSSDADFLPAARLEALDNQTSPKQDNRLPETQWAC